MAEPLNRDRLLNDDVIGLFPKQLRGALEINPLLRDDNLCEEDTLLQTWESRTSSLNFLAEVSTAPDGWRAAVDGRRAPARPPEGHSIKLITLQLDK